MNQWSVLGRYLAPFRHIVGRMQHDLFHVYTVDQHTIMVVRNLRRFMMAEHAHEYPFCSQLMSQFESPWLLIVAALFHDIAKGRGGDHSVLGERDILRFCRSYGIEGEDRQLLGFLVREHLTMSMTAQKKDIADPDVVAEFARRVQTPRQLSALYLLTVADIRATSARIWNAWSATNASRPPPPCCANAAWPTRTGSPSGIRWTLATSCATIRKTWPGTPKSCTGTPMPAARPCIPAKAAWAKASSF